ASSSGGSTCRISSSRCSGSGTAATNSTASRAATRSAVPDRDGASASPIDDPSPARGTLLQGAAGPGDLDGAERYLLPYRHAPPAQQFQQGQEGDHDAQPAAARREQGLEAG